MELEYIKNYLEEHDEFAKRMNIKIEEIGPGYAKTYMALEKHHNNSAKVAHGGAIFALVDFALAAAASTHGRLTLTASVNISYIAAGRKGPITAEAAEISDTRRLGTYEVKVRDGENVLIAVAQAIMYKKSEPFPPEESGKS